MSSNSPAGIRSPFVNQLFTAAMTPERIAGGMIRSSSCLPNASLLEYP